LRHQVEDLKKAFQIRNKLQDKKSILGHQLTGKTRKQNANFLSIYQPFIDPLMPKMHSWGYLALTMRVLPRSLPLILISATRPETIDGGNRSYINIIITYYTLSPSSEKPI
jgi:hypothetical protein